MKTAVIGCGAIGGLFLGYLTGKDEVVGIVKDYQKKALDKEGLIIENPEKNNYKVRTATILNEPVDLVIFSTKINDLEEAVVKNIEYLKDSIVLSTQNGVGADNILRRYFPPSQIITGIVMFGATFYPPNRVVHNFPGSLVIGNFFGSKITDLNKVRNFLETEFKVIESENIKGAKYL